MKEKLTIIKVGGKIVEEESWPIMRSVLALYVQSSFSTFGPNRVQGSSDRVNALSVEHASAAPGSSRSWPVTKTALGTHRTRRAQSRPARSSASAGPS